VTPTPTGVPMEPARVCKEAVLPAPDGEVCRTSCPCWTAEPRDALSEPGARVTWLRVQGLSLGLTGRASAAAFATLSKVVTLTASFGFGPASSERPLESELFLDIRAEFRRSMERVLEGLSLLILCIGALLLLFGNWSALFGDTSPYCDSFDLRMILSCVGSSLARVVVVAVCRPSMS